MSGSVLLQRRPSLRGPEDDDVEAAISALLETQQVASRALEEGAIDEATYGELLARADAIDVRLLEETTSGELRSAIRRDAEALLTEASSTRVSGGTAHRSNIWVAMIASIIASVLLVASLAAWANRRKR